MKNRFLHINNGFSSLSVIIIVTFLLVVTGLVWDQISFFTQYTKLNRINRTTESATEALIFYGITIAKNQFDFIQQQSSNHPYTITLDNWPNNDSPFKGVVVFYSTDDRIITIQALLEKTNKKLCSITAKMVAEKKDDCTLYHIQEWSYVPNKKGKKQYT